MSGLHTASTTLLTLHNVNKGYVEDVQPEVCVTLPKAAQTDVSRGETKHPVVTQNKSCVRGRQASGCSNVTTSAAQV